MLDSLDVVLKTFLFLFLFSPLGHLCAVLHADFSDEFSRVETWVSHSRDKTVASTFFFLYSCANNMPKMLLAWSIQYGVDCSLPFQVSAFSSSNWQLLKSRDVNRLDSDRILKHSNPHPIYIRIQKSDPNLIRQIEREPPYPIRVELDRRRI